MEPATEQYLIAPLRDLAAALGISIEVLAVIGAVIVVTIVILLWIIFTPREKGAQALAPMPEVGPGEELPPEDLEGLLAPIQEEEGKEDLETVLRFSPEKVQFEADVKNLTIKLINPAPKVVERVVEVPVEKVIERRIEVPAEVSKGPGIKEPLDVKQAKDLPSGVALLSRKYGLTSAVLLKGDGSLIAPESDKARAAAEEAARLASSIGVDGKEVRRVEIAGKDRRYLFGISRKVGILRKDSLTLALLSAAEGMDEATLRILSEDLKSLLERLG